MHVTSFRCFHSVVYCPGYADCIFQMFSLGGILPGYADYIFQMFSSILAMLRRVHHYITLGYTKWHLSGASPFVSLPRVALSLNPRFCRLHLSDVFPRWYIAQVMWIESYRCYSTVIIVHNKKGVNLFNLSH